MSVLDQLNQRIIDGLGDAIEETRKTLEADPQQKSAFLQACDDYLAGRDTEAAAEITEAQESLTYKLLGQLDPNINMLEACKRAKDELGTGR